MGRCAQACIGEQRRGLRWRTQVAVQREGAVRERCLYRPAQACGLAECINLLRIERRGSPSCRALLRVRPQTARRGMAIRVRYPIAGWLWRRCAPDHRRAVFVERAFQVDGQKRRFAVRIEVCSARGR